MILRDRIALITGGAAGIGRATARAFAAEGATVIVGDVDEARGRETVEEIASGGATASFERLNVADPVDVDAVFDKIAGEFGRLDILVNNAGIVRDARLVKMTVEQWDQVLAVNLKGVFLCGQAAARMMTEQGSGVILNATSVVGLYGNFGQTNYVATKAGVIGMTRTWARELGRKGVRVNAVAPGFIGTEIINDMPQKVIDMMAEKAPLGRIGQPEDIASAYLFLASEQAAFITGAVLSVDGGLVL
jgi:3-oxoacyl-[acyl-carrier protein] reductase